jgi:hypothetical protein
MNQLDLFLDFKPTEVQPKSQRDAEVVVFPLTQTAMVQRLAGRLRSIRDDRERTEFLLNRLRGLYRKRAAQGLPRAVVKADVLAFEQAVLAEYFKPTPPLRRFDLEIEELMVPFPEKTHVQQTA